MNVYEKLNEIRSKIKVPKNQYNNFGNYKYRSLEDILSEAKKYEEGLKVIILLTDEIVNINEKNYVKATAEIVDIENPNDTIKVSAFAREAETKKGMDVAQLTGATSSYARKYALQGLLGLDDGNDPDSYTNQPDNKKKGNEVVSAEEIDKLIRATGTNLDKFLSYFNVKRIGNLSPEQRITAKRLLENKLLKKGAK